MNELECEAVRAIELHLIIISLGWWNECYLLRCTLHITIEIEKFVFISISTHEQNRQRMYERIWFIFYLNWISNYCRFAYSLFIRGFMRLLVYLWLVTAFTHIAHSGLIYLNICRANVVCGAWFFILSVLYIFHVSLNYFRIISSELVCHGKCNSKIVDSSNAEPIELRLLVGFVIFSIRILYACQWWVNLEHFVVFGCGI